MAAYQARLGKHSVNLEHGCIPGTSRKTFRESRRWLHTRHVSENILWIFRWAEPRCPRSILNAFQTALHPPETIQINSGNQSNRNIYNHASNGHSEYIIRYLCGKLWNRSQWRSPTWCDGLLTQMTTNQYKHYSRTVYNFVGDVDIKNNTAERNVFDEDECMG